MEETPRLIVGITHKLRNGLKTSPLRKSNNGTSYIFEAEVKRSLDDTKPSVLAWLESGRYLTEGYDHQYDIIIN